MKKMDSEEAYIYSMGMIEQELEKMSIYNQKIHSGLIQRVILLEKRLERLESLHDREAV